MQELTTLQLIEAFKSFISACQLTMVMPVGFVKKWQVFSHYLNIYPLQSSKLVEFSTKCGDVDLERKFIEENMLKFTYQDLQNTPQKEQIENTINLMISSTHLSTHKNGHSNTEVSQASLLDEQQLPQQLYIPYIDLIQLKVQVQDQLRTAIQKMRNNTRFYKERFKNQEKRALPNVNESCISVVQNDTIKKIDANQLRQRIIILKEQDRQQIQQMQVAKGPGMFSIKGFLLKPQSQRVIKQ